jgi:peptidoglycan/xylan/chitin deacetylase (PgdA/CDA1 family)
MPSPAKLPMLLIGIVLGVAMFGGALWTYRKLNAKVFKPTYSLADDILVHGNQDLKEIALTFDDGPRPETTRPILDALAKRKIRATFFVVGSQVEKEPGLVRRMLNEGHEVGNHTYSHRRLDTLPLEEVRHELASTNRAFVKATGTHIHLFRPPGMRYTEDVLKVAQDMGYVTIHWNAAAQDYQRQDPAAIVRKVLKNTGQGSVVLLHLQPDTAVALPQILDELQAKGYRFVTVSQMLGRLPRPVFAKSNAYAVDPKLLALDRPKLVATTAAKPKPRTTRPKPKHAEPATTNRTEPKRPQGIDVPTG